LADEIFGAHRFRNEIVWCYGGGGAPQTEYPCKHDNLLWYTASEDWTFHKQFRPYSEGTMQRGLTEVKGSNYALNDEGAMLNDWWSESEVQKILSPTAYENLKYPTQKPEGLLKRIIKHVQKINGLRKNLPEPCFSAFSFYMYLFLWGKNLLSGVYKPA
jgi:hypothetical protein